MLAQQVQQALAPALALGQQQHLVRGAVQVAAQAGQRLLRATLDAQIGQGPGVVHGLSLVNRQRGQRMGAGEQLLGAQEDGFRRQDGALGVGRQHLVAFARVLPKALQGLIHRPQQGHARLGPQVVEEGGGLFKEQRQVVLDAGAGQPLAHVLVEPRLARVAVHVLAPAAAKHLARGLVERELAARQQAHLGHGVEAALAVGVEDADRVDFVAEQVDAVGRHRAHGEEVDQAATHRVLAGAHHLADVLVAGQHQLGAEGGLIQALTLFELKGGAGQEGGRRQARERGGGGQQHHVQIALLAWFALRLHQAPQRGQALGDQVVVGREAIPGQGFPVREHRHAQARREEGQFGLQALRVQGLGADDGGDAVGLFAKACQQQGIGRAQRAGGLMAAAESDSRKQGQGVGVRHWAGQKRQNPGKRGFGLSTGPGRRQVLAIQ